MTRGDNFVCSLSLIATIKKDKQNKLIADEKTKWNKKITYLLKSKSMFFQDTQTKRNNFFFR